MRTSFVSSLALLVVVASPLAAQGARVAAPSTRATAEVSLTLADTAAQRAAGKPALIRIDYGQPHLRGRALFTPTLVPYDQPWRLGANNSTLLTSDVPLEIGGQTIPAGSHVLMALPSRAGWKLIVQKHTGERGVPGMAMQYNQANDVARIDLRTTTLTSPVESFSIWLIPSTTAPARGELRMAWGTVQLSADWVAK